MLKQRQYKSQYINQYGWQYKVKEKNPKKKFISFRGNVWIFICNIKIKRAECPFNF